MHKLRKGDEVIVLAGRDKGKVGSILQILDYKRALVNDVNVVKKHTKPNPMQGVTGGIMEKEAPINISNLGLYNSDTGKAGKVGIRVLEDGRRVRYFKSSGEVIDKK